MRHRKTVKKLGRTASHRKATLRNLAAALIEHRQIRTTLTKAKAAQQFVERLITRGKEDTVHARRQVFKALQNRTLVKILFDEIAPAFADRNGGYTRVVKLGQRRGDGAQVAVLQLVGFEKLRLEESPKKKKKKKPKQKPLKTDAPAPEAEAAKTVEETPETTEAPETVESAEETPPGEKAKAGKKKTSGKKAPAKKPEESPSAGKEATESPAEEKDEANPKKESGKSGKATDKKGEAAGEGEQNE